MELNDRLPYAVLLKILACLEQPELIRLAHVSRFWRMLALTHPDFYLHYMASTATSSADDILDDMGDVFAHAVKYQLGVSLRLSIPPPASPVTTEDRAAASQVLRFVSRHIKALVKLRVAVAAEYLQGLHLAVVRTAPRLREFHAELLPKGDDVMIAPLNFLPRDVFGGKSGALCKVTLRGLWFDADPSNPPSALHCVRELYLQHPPVVLADLHVMSYFPGLRHLQVLEVLPDTRDAAPSTSWPDALATPSTLRRKITIDGWDSDAAFRWLEYPCSTEQSRFYDPCNWTALTVFFGDALILSLDAVLDGSALSLIVSPADPALLRSIECRRTIDACDTTIPTDRMFLLHPLAARLVELTVQTDLLSYVLRIAQDLPALHRLRLTADRATGVRSRDVGYPLYTQSFVYFDCLRGPGPFFSYEGAADSSGKSPYALRCPALKEIQLRLVQDDGVWAETKRLAMLAGFLGQHLLPRSDRAALVLSGANVWHGKYAPAALSRMFSDVCFCWSSIAP